MLRLVLDTDVVFAAFHSPAGASRRLFLEILDGKALLLLSATLMVEYEAVLTRPGNLKKFGIDQRATDETGNGSWVVTHLPSGLAVVSRVRALAVALALADRIAALTDWEAQNISATPELREQVREALNRAYGDFFADRLPALPEDASPAA